MDPQGGKFGLFPSLGFFRLFKTTKNQIPGMQIDAELAYYWVNTLFLARDIVFCQILVEISEK